VEKNDIFGDAVNVASRFQTMAKPGEIYVSENTYDALSDNNEFYCKHIRTTKLREMRGVYKIFKVFWNEDEIATDNFRSASAVDDTEDLGKTISIETFNKEKLASEKLTNEKASMALHKAKSLERDDELIELYLFCQAFTVNEMEDIYLTLKSALERSEKIETKLNGEKALWFFKETIIMGRVPEADFPITNKAISRVPIKIGINNGEGFLKIEGSKEVNSIELEISDKTESVKADVRYPLGKNGKIICSVCFQFEYSVYRDRLLILRVLPPEECIKKHFNFQLRDVWKDFEYESDKIIVLGV
jgi:hypothetical protein